MNLQLVVKKGPDLTVSEVTEIDRSKKREWNTPPLDQYQVDNCHFFLLKNSAGKILAQGQLVKIDGVQFRNQNFDIWGIGGIIANQKGQGHGRVLMKGIKKFLLRLGQTGVGFTADGVVGFYRKCGFQTDRGSLGRFVHLVDGNKVTNTKEDWVFYLDGGDGLMWQVLTSPEAAIFLPRDPDW